MSPETPVYRILPESQFCQVRQKASGLIALVRNAISSFIIPEYGDLCNVVLVSSDGIVIYTGKLGSLKRFKDDVKEVTTGQDCGLNIESFNDIRVGDIVEGYEQVEVKRK